METIHPIVVHFPIALLITATFIGFLAVLLKNKREELKTVLYWVLLLGGISILIALFSGIYESGRVVHNEAIHKIMETHELLGYIVAGAFVLLTLWVVLRKQNIQRKELTVIALLLLASSSVLIYSAFLGGKMVYEEGAGVKPMEKMMLEMHGGDGHQHKHGEADMQDAAGANMPGAADTGHKAMDKDSAGHSGSEPAHSHKDEGHTHDGDCHSHKH